MTTDPNGPGTDSDARCGGIFIWRHLFRVAISCIQCLSELHLLFSISKALFLGTVGNLVNRSKLCTCVNLNATGCMNMRAAEFSRLQHQVCCHQLDSAGSSVTVIYFIIQLYGVASCPA